MHNVLAQHSSIQQNIYFFQDQLSKNIFARVETEKDEVKVDLPLYPLKSSFEEGVLKIESLFRNFHLNPTYQYQKVFFSQIPPENKDWRTHPNEIEIPENAEILYRSDGTITYSSFNSLINWNYETNEKQINSIGTNLITALVEDPHGNIVCGDEKGYIYYHKQKILVKKDDRIDHIYFINSENCIVQFKGRQILLYNILEHKKVEDYSDVKSIAILGSNKFALLKENTLQILEVGEKITLVKKIEDVVQMKGLSPSKLIYKKSESNFYYDVDSATSRDLGNKDFHIFQNAHLLEDDTIVFYKQDLSLTFLSKKKSCYKAKGNWSVVKLLPLSDGSVMYATNKSGSGVHIMTQQGTTTFSDTKVTNNGNWDVHGLTELVDGSVAVKFYSLIRILKPFLNERKTKNHQIEEIRLELNHRPDILPLYQELIQLTEEPESSYKICKAGLQAAVKAKNIYQARRFYEQGRSLQPKDREIIDLFYHFLKLSPFAKLTRQLLLDRASFDGAQSIPENISKRKTKERLLIGEGDFSYTEALIKKHQETHPSLASTITATDLFHPPEDAETQSRLSFLDEKGVKILLGVEGTDLHRFFPKKRFQRIQWNCPFPEAKKRENFEKTIPGFFLSCTRLQILKDRVHITLMQHDNEYTIKRQKENPIVLGSTQAGYRLIRKRQFGKVRYPEYNHIKTNSSEKYDAGGKEREFGIRKIRPSRKGFRGSVN